MKFLIFVGGGVIVCLCVFAAYYLATNLTFKEQQKRKRK